MISRQKMFTLRHMIEQAATFLQDEDAIKAIELFPTWNIDTRYEAGIRVRDHDKLYRCEQSHISQEDWIPSNTPALWTEVVEPGEIPVWKQPTGAQDAYMKNDKVYYPNKNDIIYRSIIDNNVWEPGVYGWEKE